ncbi:MAG: 4'-phosphopantetheinyl transferase superfamily protein [Anaerolineaceae bacterium]|nr:4'-phosphopantetheinyl transferase superfamily protein [Anaerolineaceae bacterium]
MKIKWLGALLPQTVDGIVINYTPSDSLAEECLQWHSSDEINRADRFRRCAGREQFILSRGITRVVLSHYLAQQPAEINFHYGQHGKPGVDRLQFNVSHSRSTVAIVLSNEYSVGIDIEFLDRELNLDQVAKILLSPVALASWRCLPVSQKRQSLFEIWTAKEAYLKARGFGLDQNLHKISVELHESTGKFILNDSAYDGAVSLHRLEFAKSVLSPALIGTVAVLEAESVELRVSYQTV